MCIILLHEKFAPIDENVEMRVKTVLQVNILHLSLKQGFVLTLVLNKFVETQWNHSIKSTCSQIMDWEVSFKSILKTTRIIRFETEDPFFPKPLKFEWEQL